MSIPTLDGIPVKTVASDRITIRVLLCGLADGVPLRISRLVGSYLHTHTAFPVGQYLSILSSQK